MPEPVPQPVRTAKTAFLAGRIVTALVSVTVLALGYQNCAMQPGAVSGESEGSSEALSSPFAYDVGLDQIAYMSCSQTDPANDQSAFFTFRAGAYRSSGLRLREAYATYAEKFSQDEVINDLANSPANASAQPSLAIRSRSNMQGYFVTGGTGPGVQGRDFTNFFTVLNTPRLTERLLNLDEGQRVRYLPEAHVYGSRIEADLRFSLSEILAEQVRASLLNDSFLSVTYSKNAGNSQALAPADFFTGTDVMPRERSVYGTGYNIKFRLPVSVPFGQAQPNFRTRVLSTVDEVPLDPQAAVATAPGQWECPTRLQFKIFRAQDFGQGPGKCGRTADNPQDINRGDLAILRNVLRPEDWYINMAQRCIIPKKPGTCYNPNATSVQYNITQACDPAVGDVCAHFFSVCTRIVD